jgi:tRNA modification GTPase
MRNSADPIEQEGVRRARERAVAADLVLWVEDITEPALTTESLTAPVVWTVTSKIDLKENDKTQDIKYQISNNEFYVSNKEEYGFNSLLAQLGDFATKYFGSEPALVSRERQRKLLQSTSHALKAALAEETLGREDIIAEELRIAAMALGRLTGRVDVEDILDVIFRDFCIGK